jgi:hypothetical protein
LENASRNKKLWLQAIGKLLKEKKFWLRGPDLNRRQLGYEPDKIQAVFPSQ